MRQSNQSRQKKPQKSKHVKIKVTIEYIYKMKKAGQEEVTTFSVAAWRSRLKTRFRPLSRAMELLILRYHELNL